MSLGKWYGLTAVESLTSQNVVNETLLFLVVVIAVAMVVALNPGWSLFRDDERTSEEGEAGPGSDDLSKLFAQRAEELQRRYGLSSRETEVAALLLAGRSRPYIGDELVISLNTVHSHASNIYAKCGVHSHREFMDLLGKTEG